MRPLRRPSTALPSAISTTRSQVPRPAGVGDDHDRRLVGVAQRAAGCRGRWPRSRRRARPSARRRGPCSVAVPRPRRSRPAVARHPRGDRACCRPAAPGRSGRAPRGLVARHCGRPPAIRTEAGTFSRADRVGQRFPDWKTIRSRARSPRSSTSDSRASERPATRTSPAEGTSMAAPMESIVLLPLPDGPTTATISRGSTRRSSRGAPRSRRAPSGRS